MVEEGPGWGRALSAVMMPTGVVRRTPKEALPILLVRTWISLFSFLVPIHDSSDSYGKVPCMRACRPLGVSVMRASFFGFS